MDRVAWYLRGLLAQHPPAPFVPYPLPEPTADGSIGRVEAAAARYFHAVNVVLCNDQAASVVAWGRRRERILAWLSLAEAGGAAADEVAATFARIVDLQEGDNARDWAQRHSSH